MSVRVVRPGDPGHPGKGCFWVVINHRRERRKRHFATETQARKFADLAAPLLALGRRVEVFPSREVVTCPEMTLAAWWARWYAAERGGWKPTTARLYKQRWERNLKEIGGWVLATIRRSDVKAYLAEQPPTTAGRLLIPLRRCLQAAVEDGLIPGNPASRMRLPKVAGRGAVAYTAEELRQVLDAAETRVPDWYPLVLTAARTGMRVSELCGLQPGDVDFARGRIRVERQCYKGAVQTPKSGRRRDVDMSQQLAAVLGGWVQRRETDALIHARPAPVWLFGDGARPPHTDTVSHLVWRAVRDAAGVRPLTFHALRHTFASLLLMAGEPMIYVRDQLGHHSITVTADLYGHVVVGSNRAAVDRLDDAPRALPLVVTA